MKKSKLIIALSSFAMAAAGIVAVGAKGAKKAESAEAKTLSNTKLVLEISDDRWKRDSIAIQFFDASHSGWGPRIDAPSAQYYEYDISGLGFTPTGCIVSAYRR